MLKLQYNNQENQRRPSRISASDCGDGLATSGENRNCRMLKCSTISKVPPAKSRLKQPVAGLVAAASPVNASTGKEICPVIQKPSRLARLHTSNNRVRPTSLSLKNIAPTVRMSSQAISSSFKQISSTSTIPQPTKRAEPASSARNSLSTKLHFSKTSGSQNKSQSMQSTVRRKSSVTSKKSTATNSASLISPSEARSNGLKNLAVVYPQHSLRVKSSATTTTTISKLSPTTATSVSTPASSHFASSKNENAKVNSHNHKDVASRRDVHGVEAKSAATSKQDESQISGRHLQTNLGNQTDASLSNISNGISLISDSSVSVESEKTNDEHYVKSNNANHLPSAQVNKATNKVELLDKKQHGNIKQSNKHLPANTNPIAITRASNRDTIGPRLNGNTSNNCFVHDKASKSAAQTTSMANYFKHGYNPTQAINDRILPKPLGQQVLSLMMLDVGLMPPNNHLQQQQTSRSEEAHVRIQGPTLRPTLDGRLSNIQSSPIDCGRSGSFSSGKAPTSNRSNGYNSLIDFQANNDDQCNNYCFLRPSHETLRLQLRFSNEANEHPRSVSLPSSPRIRVHSRKVESSEINQQLGRVDTNGQETATSQRGDSIWRSAGWTVKNDFRTSKLSPAPPAAQKTKLNDQNHLLSLVCDSQDSYSLASSSSSSLNHYPPLLALSNQLNGFELDELVKANVDKIRNRKQGNLAEVTDSKSSEQDGNPVRNKLGQATEQHRIPPNDPDDYEFESYSGEINHLKECARHIERMNKHGEVSENPTLEPEPRGDSHAQSSEQCYVDESCASHQFRRQQPRSHSISGQEYHFNAGYQRLKQNAYTRPGAFENYSQFNTQSPSRIHQAPYSYQQSQTGRSSPPVSVISQIQYGTPQRDGLLKYSQDRQARKQLHSSLECLNTGYSDYQHQMQQYHNQNQQQHQSHLQNQHYAASYVLTQPPANTIINQNGDQDLAAAAMGTPPSQYHHSSANSNGNCMNSYNQQSLISRAMSQVSQSAQRRAGYTGGQSTTSSLMNHLASLHPMRAGHSSLSLASSSYMIEDKLQNEIKKLQSELKSEKEKNEALNSQLNINSSLMAAFEQSLTTLNTRLRQLTTLNEKKDNEIEELRAQLSSARPYSGDDKNSPSGIEENNNHEIKKSYANSERDSYSESSLLKIIEELRRQLIEKDRLLTDTRLEALSAAHQLEQLESKLNGENSMLANEDDLDEGVMVVNHSPSDSDAITDPAHFNDITSQIRRANQISTSDNISFTQRSNNNNIDGGSNENNNVDNQSNHSSDYSIEVKTKGSESLGKSISQQFNENDSGVMDRLMDSLLSTS